MRCGPRFTPNQPEAKAKTVLDLGRVDVTGYLKRGENNVEVLVYNTLANHYQTSPSPYRGRPISGLLGPVRLLSRE